MTLAGGEGRPAKVVGFDEDKDVAVLLIDTSAAAATAAAAAAASPAANGAAAAIPAAAASPSSLVKDPKTSGSTVRAGEWECWGMHGSAAQSFHPPHACMHACMRSAATHPSPLAAVCRARSSRCAWAARGTWRWGSVCMPLGTRLVWITPLQAELSQAPGER